MSDLINRQDVIRALQGLSMLKETRIWDGYKPFDFVERMFLEAEDVIKNLPSAEPSGSAGEAGGLPEGMGGGQCGMRNAE